MFRMLNPNDIQAEPGDVLINGAACFPDFEELKRSFDIIRFLDFCVGLDAAVLHNTLHSVGMSIGAVNPVLMTLIDAGFVQEYDALYPPDTQAIGNFPLLVYDRLHKNFYTLLANLIFLTRSFLFILLRPR